MVFGSGLAGFFAQLAAVGTVVRRGSCTRRQSSPSNNACNCAALNRITPSRIAGQRN
jgi:hypothetical protein